MAQQTFLKVSEISDRQSALMRAQLCVFLHFSIARSNASSALTITFFGYFKSIFVFTPTKLLLHALVVCAQNNVKSLMVFILVLKEVGKEGVIEQICWPCSMVLNRSIKDGGTALPKIS